jgi:hypothetical protein
LQERCAPPARLLPDFERRFTSILARADSNLFSTRNYA